MKDELVKEMHIDERKITVIQNPVDTELIDRMVSEGESPYPQDGRKHIVASGRFDYQKGFDLLVQAFAVICKQRNDVDLYIIVEYGISISEVCKTIVEIVRYKLKSMTGVRVRRVGISVEGIRT
jgi:glycosyltransferase involved in cell wall biosynthesis